MTVSLSCKFIAFAPALMAVLFSVAGARADEDFCGRPRGEPDAMMAEISKAAGVKEAFRGPDYVAYQDEASQAMFTFTLPAQGQAHPAAVCRKPVRDGEDMKLQMVIVCKGEGDACQRLESDFKMLNAQMEAEIRNHGAQANDKK